MKKNIFCFLASALFALILSFVIPARAAEDSEFVQIARDRYYLGGVDESDLKVQLQLVPNEKNKNLDTQESEEGF